MKRPINYLSVLIIILCLLFAIGVGMNNEHSSETATLESENIERIHFEKHDVVCFKFALDNEGGLSCFTEEELQNGTG